MGSRRRRLKHQWGSTAQTRRSILDAARAVFGRHGFAEASVAEIVELSGSSVGSMYHHFGGKAELFTALWEQYVELQDDLVTVAVVRAKDEGCDDPWELFLIAARVYLDDAWERRDLVKIFTEGDTPTGFGKELANHRRQAFLGPLQQLGDLDGPLLRVVQLTFTSVIAEARREIAKSRRTDEARRLADAVIETLRRLRPLLA